MRLRKVIDSLYPLRCSICDTLLPFLGKDEGICENCKKGICYLAEDTCLKCGKEVKKEEEYCYDCRKRTHLFLQGAALFPYEYIRDSLYRFKYGGRVEYGRFYARQIAERLTPLVRRWRPEALVPVPLYKKKQILRGYNQAEVLADELSKLWNIPVEKRLVLRVKNTRPMKEVKGIERQNNLKKAFKIGRNDVKLNTILVVDDIYTTGSTVDAVTKICHEAGIRKVYVISVSIGHGC